MAEGKGKAKTATEEEGEYLWGKVVELTQTAFRDGNLTEEATWQTVVLIPKGKGEFQGIGLVEVIWKLLTLILHRRLTAIKLHDVLHGFQEDHVKDFLPHGCKLLKQLGLEGGRPSTATFPEPVKYVMEFYRREPAVKY